MDAVPVAQKQNLQITDEAEHLFCIWPVKTTSVMEQNVFVEDKKPQFQLHWHLVALKDPKGRREHAADCCRCLDNHFILVCESQKIAVRRTGYRCASDV